MKINGNNIFIGIEENQSQQFNQPRINDEKKAILKQAVVAAVKEIDRGNDDRIGVKVSFSKEDIDFLCSEEGYQKIKKDAEAFYQKNIDRQKEIAENRDPNDPFWKNTGNQFLIFSEFLYQKDFYTNMSKEEKKEAENTLAKITAGMDHVSRNQYLTGMAFSNYYGSGSNFFMSSSEVVMELEASTSALKHFSDKYVPKEKREQFNELIDSYHTHNEEVLKEYQNPFESFNKAVYALNYGGNLNVLRERPPKQELSEDYRYTLLLGGITKSAEEKNAFQQKISSLFEELRKNKESQSGLWDKLDDTFIKYVTDNSEDKEFKQYMREQSQSTFKRIKRYWSIF